jgi:maltooligosyltrehalose trehalohydrolase
MSDPQTLPMGATLEDGGVRFRVWAPDAQRVQLELPERLHDLTPEGDGVWSELVDGLKAGARYRFRLDEQGSFPDPYSRSQPEGPHGPSEVIDPGGFEWHDQDWHGVGIDGLVIYQCHVGTATPEGTFDALTVQLRRLKSLGVNAVQPLPLAEVPGSRNWGYDGVDLFAPTRNYGGYAGFQRFVDAAHQHGLGVIVDVIYNHFGPDGNFLRAYSPDYFTDRYQTPWGEAINYDGPRSTWARRLVVDNAHYWLHELHADGLRVDATHAIFDNSSRHILAELTQSIRESTPNDRRVVLIAETHENDVRYLKPVDEGGFGFDAVYADDFHHTLRRYLAGDSDGYYADYVGSLDEVARCVHRGWLYEGQESARTRRKRGTNAAGQPARGFLYVIQNHDQVGNRALGERLHHQIDLERYMTASTLLLFLPFTPMLFMGQEFAASSPFQFFTDFNPELGRSVTEGRRKEFAGFAAFSDPEARERIPDPQDEATFLRSKLPLDEASRPPGADVHALYERLLHLRRTDSVLLTQARQRLSVSSEGETLTVRRWNATEERLLVVNFGDAPADVTQFGSDWAVLLATRQPEGSRLAPRSAVIFGRAGARNDA